MCLCIKTRSTMVLRRVWVLIKVPKLSIVYPSVIVVQHVRLLRPASVKARCSFIHHVCSTRTCQRLTHHMNMNATLAASTCPRGSPGNWLRAEWKAAAFPPTDRRGFVPNSSSTATALAEGEAVRPGTARARRRSIIKTPVNPAESTPRTRSIISAQLSTKPTSPS